MPIVLLVILLLTACTPSSIEEAYPLAFKNADPVPVARVFSQTGSVFLGKFATASAINSNRSFASDYYGEVRFTLYPNEKVDCRYWIEGRITDKTIYEGVNGFIEGTSLFCTGRLQRDNSFEFQGAYSLEAPKELEIPKQQVFTMRGVYTGETIEGNIVLGSVLQNDVVLIDTDELLDLTEGIGFEAILLED